MLFICCEEKIWCNFDMKVILGLTTRRFFLKQIFWMQNFGIFREFSRGVFSSRKFWKKSSRRKKASSREKKKIGSVKTVDENTILLS